MAACVGEILEGADPSYSVKILKTTLDVTLFSKCSPDVLRRIRAVANYFKNVCEEDDGYRSYSQIDKRDIPVIVNRLLANSTQNAAPQTPSSSSSKRRKSNV